MSKEMIEERVKNVMAGLFDVEVEQIGPDASIETVERWDSLQHVNLIMALEQEFAVTFDVDDAATMIAFPDVCKMLARYLDGV